MRKEKRWRYYCDFCNKAGGHRYYMERHEKSCTLNPNRKCRMCGVSGTTSLVGMEIKTGRYGELANPEEVMKKLDSDTNGCPACKLAAIRQSGHAALFFEHFNYKEENKNYWDG